MCGRGEEALPWGPCPLIPAMLAVGIQGGWRQPRGGQPPHILGGLLQGLVTYTVSAYYFVKKTLSDTLPFTLCMYI
jgi:hypothetical protein